MTALSGCTRLITRGHSPDGATRAHIDKQAHYSFILLYETPALHLNKFIMLRVIKQNERAEELTADHADVIGSITNSECHSILASLD